jgi:predicted O-methyltransferase YrrM
MTTGRRASPLGTLDRVMWNMRAMLPTLPGPPLIARPQDFPTADMLGCVFPSYQRTYDFPGEFVDTAQAAIAVLPAKGGLIQVETLGFLRTADALALYELAYFSAGDVLELGSAWGLSTTFLCQAALNAGRGTRVLSIEKEPAFQAATARTIHAHGLTRCYCSMPGAADEMTERLVTRNQTFGFVFVDFDHTYAGVGRLCGRLRRMLRPSGMVLFHDFKDERNMSVPDEYGVYPAVAELLDDKAFAFMGMIGCCALVYRT